MADKKVTEENSKIPSVEPVPLEQKKDFFHVEGKDPRFHYHWVDSDPRRVQELKREGYEVDPATTSGAAKDKVEQQREYLKRHLDDPKTTKADATVAKDILDRMETAPVDTKINIPGHILMRTSVDNRRRRMEDRLQRSKSLEESIQADIRDLNKTLQKSGKGGIKAFRELFDSIK